MQTLVYHGPGATAGLSAVKGAHLFSPSHIIAIDIDESRPVGRATTVGAS